MIDTDAKKWIGRPANTMTIHVVIDKKNRTVHFTGPVGFEDSKIIVQSLIDGFGWPKQDVTFDVVSGGPTVEPCAPIPVTNKEWPEPIVA
jgi:hypothetical protein